MWAYAAVFLLSFGVDVIPVLGPPAWMGMVYLLEKYDLNPWLVLLAGVPGSTLGRYCLSLYIPRFSKWIITQKKNDEMEFVGKKLQQKLWRNWLFVFLYSLLPLSTTALFSAVGLARIGPLQFLPPFFAGKFASDAMMVFTGHYAVIHLADLERGAFSVRGILATLIGLALLGAVLFLDWRVLLEKKKLRFNFHIWK